MKFREYNNIFPKVVKAYTPKELENLITEYATKYNMIDLQYSTTENESIHEIEYSALMLLQEKNL